MRLTTPINYRMLDYGELLKIAKECIDEINNNTSGQHYQLTPLDEKAQSYCGLTFTSIALRNKHEMSCVYCKQYYKDSKESEEE